MEVHIREDAPLAQSECAWHAGKPWQATACRLPACSAVSMARWDLAIPILKTVSCWVNVRPIGSSRVSQFGCRSVSKKDNRGILPRESLRDDREAAYNLTNGHVLKQRSVAWDIWHLIAREWKRPWRSLECGSVCVWHGSGLLVTRCN